MSVPRTRVVDLLRTQSKIFNTTFNPTGIRTGNKILRQRLVGPAVANYYMPRFVIFRDVQKAYPQDCYEMYDEREAYFAEKAVMAKARGKGAPKKKRTAAESKKFKGRKTNLSAAAAALAAGGGGGGGGGKK